MDDQTLTPDNPSILISRYHLDRLGNVEIGLLSLKEFIDLAGEHHQSPRDYYGAMSSLLEPMIEELQHVEALMHRYEGNLPDKGPAPIFELKKRGGKD